MKVFIGNSYGDIKVYYANTKEEVLSIVDEINMVFEIMNEVKFSVQNISNRIDKEGLEKVCSHINTIIYSIAFQKDNDIFDFGSGFTTVERPNG